MSSFPSHSKQESTIVKKHRYEQHMLFDVEKAILSIRIDDDYDQRETSQGENE